MNDNASLYSDTCHLQQVDAVEFLERYLNLMQVKSGGNFMDVGAADGLITSEVLMPKLPKNLQKLIGADIATNMVKFAKKKCQDKPKLDFVHLDITSETMSKQFRSHFDGIFSFYCFNWVTKNQQALAFKNIFDMLKPGGSMLVTIIVYTPLYAIWENMSQHKKWASYSNEVPKYVSMYMHLEDPKEKLKSFLEEVGFDIHVCQLENRSHTYPSSSHFWNWASAISPLVKIVPENKLHDYEKDFLEEMKRNKDINVEVENNQETVTSFYKILVACASKPL